MISSLLNTTRFNYVQVLLIDRRARLQAVKGYILNTAMIIETKTLQLQIDALEKEEKRLVKEVLKDNVKEGK